jgi:hypothetical protein
MIPAAGKAALNPALVFLPGSGTAAWSLSCGAVAMLAMGSGLVSREHPSGAAAEPPDTG